MCGKGLLSCNVGSGLWPGVVIWFMVWFMVALFISGLGCDLVCGLFGFVVLDYGLFFLWFMI